MLQRGKHPVEIVLIYAHACGQLGDRDTWLLLNDRERFAAAPAAPLTPPPLRDTAIGFAAVAARV